jgi:hypothetical protein
MKTTKMVSVITDGTRTFSFHPPLSISHSRNTGFLYEYRCDEPALLGEGCTSSEAWADFVNDFVRIYNFVVDVPDEELNLPGRKVKQQLLQNLDRKMKKMLVYYVRNEARKMVGAVVAIGKDQVGWSQCSPKDRFDKKKGVLIASGRADKGTKVRMREDETATLIRDALAVMEDRARRYFK